MPNLGKAGEPYQPGLDYSWIPRQHPIYCESPPREVIDAESLIQNPEGGRWHWKQPDDPRIPEAIMLQWRADPFNVNCPIVGTSPPPPPVGKWEPPPPPEPLDVPPEFAAVYNDACAQLEASSAELEPVIEHVWQAAADPLLGNAGLLNSLTDELLGAADNELAASWAPLAKLVNKLVDTPAQQISKNNADLVGAGLNVPWSWVDMRNAVDGDPLQMLTDAIPQFAPWLGNAPKPFPGAMGDQPQVMPVPAADYGAGDDRYSVPSVPYSPTIGTAPLDPTAYQNADTTADWSVPPDYVAPLSPSPPLRQTTTTTTTQTTKDGACCPAPVNVTVNVPPIVFPGYLPPTSPQPTPTPANPTSRRPYPGTPPKSMVANGDVSYWVEGGTWVYNDNRTYNSPTDVVNLANPIPAPGAPAPAPAPAPQQSTLIGPLPPAGTGGAIIGAVNWGDMSACKAAHDSVTGMKAAGAIGAAKKFDGWAANYIDSQVGDGSFDWAKRTLKINGIVWEDVAKKFSETTEGWKEGLHELKDSITGAFSWSQVPFDALLNKNSAETLGAKIALARKGEAATSFPLTYLGQSDIYTFQYANPQFLPNQIRTDSAFLANTLTESEWICWTRAGGNHPEPFRRAMLADQTRPNVREIMDLYRRGKMTEKDFYVRMREQGVLDPNYSREYLAVSTNIPTQSDLVRFMVRDASDDEVSKLYGYDEGFTDKYTKQMQEWAKANALDETYFRYSWRAHWQIPSYTQLTEMAARLRPDRLEIKEFEAENPTHVDPPRGKPGLRKPPSVTIDDVKKALEINDMAPGWVDKLVAVSYTPINRTDAVRAYMMGAFSDEQLRDSFLNTKYSPRDADLMLDFYRRDKARRQRSVAGTWSPRKVVRYYKSQLITRTAAVALLKPIMLSPAMVESTLAEAEQEMSADLKATRIKAMRRAFLFGEVTESDVIWQLGRSDIETAQAERLLATWSVERDGRLKQPTVAMIGKWLGMSIISVEDARRRLTNLGYKLVDADRIVAAALKMDWEGNPPTNEELTDSISAAVKNQQEARARKPAGLVSRLRAILLEAGRIKKELDRRANSAGDEPMAPLVIP